MSYLVLARKWRPQTFEDVIGQGHVTRTLQNALKSDRVAHALLFSGPRGVGKTSVARILSKALNCEKGPSPVPCNECSICRQITAGHNVDVNEIDGASNRGIDEIRQLREDIRFQPAQCRFRIYIIDEVHMLTKEAFNALLKTLEEPPPHAYFVFATTEPRKIPPTIHSRCQHFEFRRLPEERLADHLDLIVEKEGLGLPREATLLLAREAEGSVRDSLSLLDQVAAFGATSYQEVCEALGVIGVDTVERLALSILESDIFAVLSTLNRVYAMGADLPRLGEDLLKFFRDLAILKRLKPDEAASLIELDSGRVDKLKERFENCSFHQVLQAMQILSSGMEDVYRSTDPRMTMEVMLMRLCTLKEFSSLDELLQKVEGLLKVYREAGNTGQAPPAERPPGQDEMARHEEGVPPGTGLEPADTEPPDREPVSIKDSWDEFVEKVKKERPSVGSALETCTGFSVSGESSVEVTCRPDFTGEMLRERDNVAFINQVAQDFFRRPVEVTFKTKTGGKKAAGTGNTRRNSSRTPGKNRRDQLINNPLVQEALNLFQARISGVTVYNNRRYRKKNQGA